MKKLIIRCKFKRDALLLKEDAISKGFTAIIYTRCGKPTCMISSDKEIPEEIAKAFLGNRKNMAK